MNFNGPNTGALGEDTMDKERIKQLAQMRTTENQDLMIQTQYDDLQLFLNTVFGRKRLIILKVNQYKSKIVKRLNDYTKENGIEFVQLNGKKLTSEAIKGEWDIFYENGLPLSRRKKPFYISEQKQMIIVNDLEEDTDSDIIRAFIYMGRLGVYFDDVENLPGEKLPNGSSYIFIAEDNFPLERFIGISSNGHDEIAILDLRDFQTRVKEHLGRYRKNTLKVTEEGIYFHRGEGKSYEHILPKEKERLNIIEKYRAAFFDSDYSQQIKLHQYFHHMNSSQAMCINFFYPLIREKSLDALINHLGFNGKIDYDPEFISFEKISEVERSVRRTNFDFYIKLNTGTILYFEIKYTESEFGKTSQDTEHSAKFYDNVETLLQNNPAIKEVYKSEAIFLDNYQVMRNLIHIDNTSYVVFIYPIDNKGIRLGAENARKRFIEDEWKDHLILLNWEDLIGQLKNILTSPELVDYFDKDFTHKYLDI
jgi:hypothetical protein